MGIMGIIWTIIVGLIVGILARWFYPGPVPMSWWLTALIGIGGSIVGGFISGLIWKSPDGQVSPGRLDHVDPRRDHRALGLHEVHDVTPPALAGRRDRPGE